MFLAFSLLSHSVLQSIVVSSYLFLLLCFLFLLFHNDLNLFLIILFPESPFFSFSLSLLSFHIPTSFYSSSSLSSSYDLHLFLLLLSFIIIYFISFYFLFFLFRIPNFSYFTSLSYSISFLPTSPILSLLAPSSPFSWFSCFFIFLSPSSYF